MTACSLLALCAALLTGCGSDSSSVGVLGSTTTNTAGGSSNNQTGNSGSPGPDRSADFAINTDAVSKNTFIKPGQTLTVTLDLLSINGYPNPITLSAAKMTSGWTAVFPNPTVASLPKGITKVTFNLTAPSTAAPTDNGSVQITASSGNTIRYLDGGAVYKPSDGGNFSATVTGLALTQVASGTTPFSQVPFAGSSGDVTAFISLSGAGLTGPVTVTLTNPNAGLSVSLPTSTFTPTTASLFGTVQVVAHLTGSEAGGGYPLTLTAAAADGTKATTTFSLYLKSAKLTGSPTLILSGAVGSTASITKDLLVTGLPGTVVQLSTVNLPTGINVTVSPTSVTVPASGSIAQPVTLQAQIQLKNNPGLSPGYLQVDFPDGSSVQTPFLLNIQ